jgi:hypothetical protein
MPFGRKVRVEVVNGSPRRTMLYFQIDYTLQAELPPELGVLHVSFRRENPTVMRRDFVIADDFRGPGRFLGCNVGVRIIDPCTWYGEGEVKVFRDGDTELPTICGTGLEDYVGSAWGLGAPAPYGGAPLSIGPNTQSPDFVGSSLARPTRSCSSATCASRSSRSARCSSRPGRRSSSRVRAHRTRGRRRLVPRRRTRCSRGIAERADDYCAAFVYCREPQPSAPRPRCRARRHRAQDFESVNPQEALQGVIDPGATT